MTTAPSINFAQLKEKLAAVIAQASEKELRLEPEFLAEYCRLTGHDYNFYQSRDRVPPGFLMTFTAPSISELFLAFFTRFPGAIKGAVHSLSKI